MNEDLLAQIQEIESMLSQVKQRAGATENVEKEIDVENGGIVEPDKDDNKLLSDIYKMVGDIKKEMTEKTAECGAPVEKEENETADSSAEDRTTADDGSKAESKAEPVKKSVNDAKLEKIEKSLNVLSSAVEGIMLGIGLSEDALKVEQAQVQKSENRPLYTNAEEKQALVNMLRDAIQPVKKSVNFGQTPFDVIRNGLEVQKSQNENKGPVSMRGAIFGEG